MAKLIPSDPPDDIHLKPERDVARALVEQLGDEITVFHSYPWLNAKRDETGAGRYLEQGEADFIVLHPRFGLLDIEVKGGEVVYDIDNRSFHRVTTRGRKRITDPFEQGRGNIHAIKDRVMKNMPPQFSSAPFTHGYAAIFPDCTFDASVLPAGGEDPAVAWDARHLGNISQHVEGAFRAWDRRRQAQPLPPEVMRSLRSALLPHFRLIPALGRSVEHDEESLLRLTGQQRGLVKFIHDQTEALIQGVAGSGKTLLAMDAATDFATQGLRTLFLCFNEPLAEDLQRACGGTENLTILHFHRWCRQCCTSPQARAGGIRFIVPQDEAQVAQFWNKDSAELLLLAIEAMQLRYDAVVVDEGQDFVPDWWFPISEVLASDGTDKEKKFFIFFDPAQNLYERKLHFPITKKPHQLTENCRNTKKIAGFCRSLSKTPLSSHSNAPDGENPEIEVAENDDAQRTAVARILDQLTGRGALQPRQIALITAGRVDKSPLAGLRRLGKHVLVTSLNDWRSGGGVLLEGAKRFKGLEADAIVLVGVPALTTGSHFGPRELYVASSRAKHRLFILCYSKEDVKGIRAHLATSKTADD